MNPEGELLRQDAAARTAALDGARSFIVQAPAGSGKTELLIQRYLKLLATVDAPEEIIAITFTVKATAEMRLRVLAALAAAAAGERPEEPHRALTYDLAAAVAQRSHERAWRLAENPGRMRIQTLDALNASIARTRPLTARGSGFGNLLDDAGMATAYRAAAAATLDWLADDGDVGTATQRVLRHLDVNTNAYVGYLADMLKSRDHWLPFVGSGDLDGPDADALRQVASRKTCAARSLGYLERVAAALAPYEEIANVFDHAAQALAERDDGSSPILALAGYDRLPPATAAAVDAWRGVADLLLKREARPTFRTSINVRQGFPKEGKDKKQFMLAMLEALASETALATLLHGTRELPDGRIDDAQWQVITALFRLLPVAVVELQRLFAASGSTDYTEVALQAGEALGHADAPGEIALLLDHQVRHILVDEMQDTSVAQYAMLEALTAGWVDGDGRSLFCVGDPMQSIYRFRNAEVGRFLTACEHGIGTVTLQPLILRRNFRSGEHLVDWFNAVFPGVMPAGNDVAFGAVTYSAAAAAEHLQGAGEVAVHPVFGTPPEIEAATVRGLIQSVQADAEGDSIAVLVRSRTQLPALLAELRAHGIDYSSVEIDRLTDLPEIIDVLALTRAAAHAGDRIAWLGVLRAPWIGLSWADLHALVHSERRRSVRTLICDPERVSRLSVDGAAALERARPELLALGEPDGVRSLRDRVETAWLRLGGPAALADDAAVENVYRFLDLLEREESHGTLADVAALESLLDAERVSRGADADLQIMTMHKAKGLQFDHVILPGLGRTSRSDQAPVLSWLDLPDAEGRSGLVIGPLGARAETDKDPVQRFIAMASRIKADNEVGRLLYVACTRARRSLHLVGHVAADDDGFSPPPAGSLLSRLWPKVEPDFVAAFDAHAAVDEADARTPTWLMPRRRVLRRPWELPAVDAPLTTERKPRNADPVDFYWVGTEAPIAGTLVHRWLHRIACGRAGRYEDVVLRRTVTARWLREMGHPNDAEEAIAARVDAALQSMFDDETGRWLLAGDGHAELALTGTYDGELVSVVLDRVRIDDDGTHWLVDYKTSSHEGGNLSGFLAAEVERYRAQLTRYATLYAGYADTVPRCALYFPPLLQEFVEVDVAGSG